MNLQAYIGKPFRPGAHGPDAFDCWGLVHTAAADLFGMALPDAVYASITPAEIAGTAADVLRNGSWVERDRAGPGVVLALAGYDERVQHVALCLDDCRALHATLGMRSCVMSVHKLRALYPVARFYAWAR